MKKLVLIALVLLIAVTAIPVAADGATTEDDACWGQATAVFAQMGKMGEHASQEPTPRAGLRNLARQLHEAGLIEDDSMTSLGQFVAENTDPPLSIDACMD